MVSHKLNAPANKPNKDNQTHIRVSGLTDKGQRSTLPLGSSM